MYITLEILSLTILLIHVPFSLANGQWNTQDFMKRDHSLVRPYYGTGVDIPHWDFKGSTIVTQYEVRLTPDLQSKTGAIWNSIPVYVRNWELQVQFKVHGHGKDLFGDGMVIWYTKERMGDGPVFGNKDFFSGLAIILDTYSNHNGPHNHAHPYISAMVNNGSLHYDHDRDGTHTQLAGCEAKFRNVAFDTHISIRYEKETLTVSTDIENKAGWKECFQVKDVKLPTGYYFGVTATTGDLSDNHDIISMRLFELDLPGDPQNFEDRSNIIPAAKFYEAPREHVDDPKPASMSGIKIFFYMLLGSIAIVALVVVGVMLYQRHQNKKMKRFY